MNTVENQKRGKVTGKTNVHSSNYPGAVLVGSVSNTAIGRDW